MVENIGIMINTPRLSVALGTVVLRFVGATLLHALASGIVGYYWAVGLTKGKTKGLVVSGRLLVVGLALASLLHAVFNYLIITLKDTVVYPTIFLILISLFVFWDFEKLKSNR